LIRTGLLLKENFQKQPEQDKNIFSVKPHAELLWIFMLSESIFFSFLYVGYKSGVFYALKCSYHFGL